VRDKLQKSYIVDSIYANVEGPIKLTKGKMKKNVQNRAKIDKESIEQKRATSFLFVKFPIVFFLNNLSGNLLQYG
jgi:hypothetical protein